MSANLGESVRLGRKVCEEDSAVTLRASDGKMGDNQPVVAHHHAVAYNGDDIRAMRYIVRRLTPTECERLMGLPDGWTIPSNLKITEELVEEFRKIHDNFNTIMAEYEGEAPPKPKTANQVRKWLEKIAHPDTCPDAPRYKGCGNGMCTNQVRWIFTRLLVSDGIDPWEAMS
jgi:site-specific DNA-cytosine methylase